jgi:hypothetical protein
MPRSEHCPSPLPYLWWDFGKSNKFVPSHPQEGSNANPGRNILQQQARFDAFIREFNNEPYLKRST